MHFEGKYLLIKINAAGKEFFDLPGGRVQHGDNPYQALERKGKE